MGEPLGGPWGGPLRTARPKAHPDPVISAGGRRHMGRPIVPRQSLTGLLYPRAVTAPEPTPTPFLTSARPRAVRVVAGDEFGLDNFRHGRCER